MSARFRLREGQHGTDMKRRERARQRNNTQRVLSGRRRKKRRRKDDDNNNTRDGQMLLQEPEKRDKSLVIPILFRRRRRLFFPTTITSRKEWFLDFYFLFSWSFIFLRVWGQTTIVDHYATRMQSSRLSSFVCKTTHCCEMRVNKEVNCN